ncbi:MAG: hypothetical protein CMK82_11290 [Pseudomonadales bacterium]|uniref:hypothetical protein n=1 Tax=Sphingobium sp. TaxID=1912891 RepID=UPI000C4A0926|nr:hypothetical protein [Sphingobium sp.]MAS67364.1 hypothetical protein [Pseudomonadales bacterium]MBS90859.1 hypothetical protein [Sphingobium sp.]
MKLLDYLDRVGQRRVEMHKISPPRPRDTRMLVGVLFFFGYYALIWRFMSAKGIPADNLALIKDAMLILGPVIGAIGQALFRSDVRDEIATQNTGEAFRANRAASEATKAAADSIPNSGGAGTSAGAAADAVAGAAVDAAAEVKAGKPGTEGMETDV